MNLDEGKTAWIVAKNLVQQKCRIEKYDLVDKKNPNTRGN